MTKAKIVNMKINLEVAFTFLQFDKNLEEFSLLI